MASKTAMLVMQHAIYWNFIGKVENYGGHTLGAPSVINLTM